MILFVLGAIGLLMAVVGWYLDHLEQNQWVIKILARRYVRAIKAYNKMLKSGLTIQTNDPGFREIASMLWERLPGQTTSTIATVTTRIKGVGQVFTSHGVEDKVTIAIKITLEDGQSVEGDINDLRPEIRKRFLEEPLFKWSQKIFWAGIITAFGALLFQLLASGEGSTSGP